MSKRIKDTSRQAERIQHSGGTLPRIEPAEFAAALGAEPCGERLSGDVGLISLAQVGHELMKRLRSTGGRPSLANATEVCKVPLTPDDMAALEKIISAIERATGTRPSLGQLASVILTMHLKAIAGVSGQADGKLDIASIQEEIDRLGAFTPRLKELVATAGTIQKSGAAMERTVREMKENLERRIKEVVALLQSQSA